MKRSTIRQLKNILLILICILILVIIVLLLFILSKGHTKQSVSLNKSSIADVIATVTIGNITPVATSVQLNGNAASGAQITLIEGSTTPTTGMGEVTVSGTVTDGNSCKDLADVTVKVYTGNLSDCTATNNSTCYVLDDSNPSAHGGCTTPDVLTYSVNNSTINSQLAMEYYAAPGTWKATVIPTDHAGLNTAGESTSSGITLNTLTALAVTSTINFGTVNNEDTSTGNHTATITNTGNIAIDYSLSGQNLACSVLGSIPVSDEEYSTNAQAFTYESTPVSPVASLSGTDALVTADIPVATYTGVPPSTQASTQPSYWQIYVPYSVTGLCSGDVTFTADAH